MGFKESKRALRRFHRWRLLKNRKKYWGLNLYDNKVETNILLNYGQKLVV